MQIYQDGQRDAYKEVLNYLIDTDLLGADYDELEGMSIPQLKELTYDALGKCSTGYLDITDPLFIRFTEDR